MDMHSGYWQIEVDEADREKKAFITSDGLYEFKVISFGLCNVPTTFERRALTSSPALALYDQNSPTELHTDADGYGIGAVLVQQQDGKERVISYVSRTLTKAEKNYSITEREYLAVIWSITKFRP
ncbi:transposon Ty3-I Gag-Pol polyprotein [Trichonephila clavipes]|nr:transposon Ty3-I Gag-Pol polyprotein [Trichonephila clavipes]